VEVGTSSSSKSDPLAEFSLLRCPKCYGTQPKPWEVDGKIVCEQNCVDNEGELLQMTKYDLYNGFRFDDNKKNNMMAWTDRIFYKERTHKRGSLNYKIHATCYNALFDIDGSDHKPVMCSLTMRATRTRGLPDPRKALREALNLRRGEVRRQAQNVARYMTVGTGTGKSKILVVDRRRRLLQRLTRAQLSTHA